MPDLVVIVPSRGRPDTARELADAFEETCTAGTELMFALDDDDPTRDEYGIEAGWVSSPSTSMVQALNYAARYVTDVRPPFAVGFMGDDHRPRSAGWDRAYLDALRELGTGIVHGNDLLQGERLATQCAMTSDIVRALGYMAPPALAHLYVDNFWMLLGSGAGCLRYLPEVVVEHMHPLAGKAQWDAGYVRVNDPGMYARDEAAFRAYAGSGALSEDIAKVRALRGAHV